MRKGVHARVKKAPNAHKNLPVSRRNESNSRTTLTDRIVAGDLEEVEEDVSMQRLKQGWKPDKLITWCTFCVALPLSDCHTKPKLLPP